MQIPLLSDIAIILGVSIAVLLLCQRFRAPSIIAFLLTGILVGPHGLALIHNRHEVEVLAEIGVVLLLFTIGIEFSLEKLIQVRRFVLGGGSLQILLTVAVAGLAAIAAGYGFSIAVFIGFLVSLSSTAVVLKLLQERAEIDSAHGQLVLAVLIFQDLAVVPMILLTPMLAGSGGGILPALALLAVKVVAVVLLAIGGARYVVPPVLLRIARLRSREIFLMCIVTICLAVAWLTASIGLSLALGAFIAGLVISESEYSHQALSSILPFRDLFTSFFFVSIGMFLDVHFVVDHAIPIVLLTLLVLLVKTIVTAGVGLVLGVPLTTALAAGLAICQVGEFSFILSQVGVESSLLTASQHQMFMAVTVLTMSVSPFLISLSMPLSNRLAAWQAVPAWLRDGASSRQPAPLPESAAAPSAGHLIIVGFGINGRNVAAAAKLGSVPYVILEANPDTVRLERKQNDEPIMYGDASQEAVLEHAGVARARVLVVTLPDPVVTRKITAAARALNANLYIIARTRFVLEVAPLQELGANEVIPEEFETSIEILNSVLKRFLIPRDVIELFSADLRADGYRRFRDDVRLTETQEITVHKFEIATFRVSPGSAADGVVLGILKIQRKYELTVVAIQRQEQVITSPGDDEMLCTDDVVVLAGNRLDIVEAAVLFRSPASKRVQ